MCFKINHKEREETTQNDRRHSVIIYLKACASRINKEHLKFKNKKINQLKIKKKIQDVNRHFSKEDTAVAMAQHHKQRGKWKWKKVIKNIRYTIAFTWNDQNR